MRRCAGLVWAWCWLPCLAFLTWFIAWSAGTIDHFVTFGVYRDVEPFAVRLGEHARLSLQEGLRRWRLRIVGSGSVGERDPVGPRTWSLAVHRSHLARLDSDLPYSGREFVPGALAVGGEQLEVEVRYRGDTLAHWGFAKKSFRVRTVHNARLEGMASFNLLAPKYPEQLNNYLSYRLAARLGLLVPQVELANVRLNGVNHGLYLMVEQPGASTVGRAGRTPGVLCIGELLARDAWTGVPRELFLAPGLWETDALGALPATAAVRPLADLIAAIQEPASEASMARLAELVDIEQFARLSLLEQLTQTHHFDHFHNWRLHWDPERRRFEPLVWDAVGWQQSMQPGPGREIELQPVFSPLAARLHAHAGFLVARDRLLRWFFSTGQDRVLLGELQHALAQVAAPIAADPNLRPPDDAAVAAAQREFAGFVRRVVDDLRNAWLRDPGGMEWRRSRDPHEPLRLRLATPRPAPGLRLRFRAPPRPARVRLLVPRGDGVGETDLAGRWQVVGDELVIDLALPSAVADVFQRHPSGYFVRNHRCTVVPTCYEIEVAGVDMTGLHEVSCGPDSDGRRFTPMAELPSSPVHGLYQVVPPAR